MKVREPRSRAGRPRSTIDKALANADLLPGAGAHGAELGGHIRGA